MRGHTLTVKETEDHTADDPDYDWTIDCDDPATCGGYEECPEKHEVDGVDAAAGPWDCECPGEHGVSTDRTGHLPWCDEDEFEFHGVLHTYRQGWNWTTPFIGCVVAAQDNQDSAWDIARDLGPGVYKVDDDWSDESCYLTVIPDAPAPT